MNSEMYNFHLIPSMDKDGAGGLRDFAKEVALRIGHTHAGDVVRRKGTIKEEDFGEQEIYEALYTVARRCGAEGLCVKTPLGTLTAKPSRDAEYHPGIWVELSRPGKVQSYDCALALIEYTADDTDTERPEITTRVWDDVCDDEYGIKVTHENIEKWFSDEPLDNG